jgi:hypothetical protein
MPVKKTASKPAKKPVSAKSPLKTKSSATSSTKR